MGIGETDQGQGTAAGIARPRAGDRALEDLHQQVRPRVGEQGGRAGPPVAQRDERDTGAERHPRAAQVGEPAHHTGTTAGPGTGTKASISGRPS